MTDIERMQVLVTELADLAYEALDTPTGERDQQLEMSTQLGEVLIKLADTGLYDLDDLPAETGPPPPGNLPPHDAPYPRETDPRV